MFRDIHVVFICDKGVLTATLFCSCPHALGHAGCRHGSRSPSHHLSCMYVLMWYVRRSVCVYAPRSLYANWLRTSVMPVTACVRSLALPNTSAFNSCVLLWCTLTNKTDFSCTEIPSGCMYMMNAYGCAEGLLHSNGACDDICRYLSHRHCTRSASAAPPFFFSFPSRCHCTRSVFGCPRLALLFHM